MSHPRGAEVIILVDDDEAVRKSMKFALELEGLRVRLYEGPQELLSTENMPERGCLVLDYYMPGLTGVELLDRLRARKIRLPAILITAKANNRVRHEAAAAGFHRVLEKPLHDGSLVESIRTVLGTPGNTPVI